jgi:hypothetical protein
MDVGRVLSEYPRIHQLDCGSRMRRCHNRPFDVPNVMVFRGPHGSANDRLGDSGLVYWVVPLCSYQVGPRIRSICRRHNLKVP